MAKWIFESGHTAAEFRARHYDGDFRPGTFQKCSGHA